MQQLPIESKILMFKTLAISKVVHLALVKDVTSSAIRKNTKTNCSIRKNTKTIYLEKQKS